MTVETVIEEEGGKIYPPLGSVKTSCVIALYAMSLIYQITFIRFGLALRSLPLTPSPTSRPVFCIRVM
ncbi:MAG: hypothetical protein H3Z53_09400 [archaeon]|nr:hypothetical protein [archaeon]